MCRNTSTRGRRATTSTTTTAHTAHAASSGTSHASSTALDLRCGAALPGAVSLLVDAVAGAARRTGSAVTRASGGGG